MRASRDASLGEAVRGLGLARAASWTSPPGGATAAESGDPADIDQAGDYDYRSGLRLSPETARRPTPTNRTTPLIASGKWVAAMPTIRNAAQGSNRRKSAMTREFKSRCHISFSRHSPEA